MNNQKVTYGKVKCVVCGTETTLDKTVWNDALMGHRCEECRKKDVKNGRS